MSTTNLHPDASFLFPMHPMPYHSPPISALGADWTFIASVCFGLLPYGLLKVTFRPFWGGPSHLFHPVRVMAHPLLPLVASHSHLKFLKKKKKKNCIRTKT
jgi:hypothetical protein